MKIQIYSQWNKEAYAHARVKQFSKAAKLLGESDFCSYAVKHGTEASSNREAVAGWVAVDDKARAIA